MKEQVRKYMIQNARVFCITLKDAVKSSAELNGLSSEEAFLLGKLQVFACCIAALQKDERASVVVRLSSEEGCFSATADRDGLVRGRKEEKDSVGEDTLEVTLQLPLRGNYTGVVTGEGFDSLVEGYFARSLQIASTCRIFVKEDVYFCVVTEQLPGEPCDLAQISRVAEESFSKGETPDGFTFLEQSDLRFGCTCSRGALMRFVSAMPQSEREELSENGKIVTFCNACGKKYTFEI